MEKKQGTFKLPLPEGAALDVFSEFPSAAGVPATGDCLLLEVRLPAAASLERISRAAQEIAADVRTIPGVSGTLALSSNPLDGFAYAACVVLRLDAKGSADRREVVRQVRGHMRRFAEAATTVRDPSPRARDALAIDMAVAGQELPDVRRAADALAERLRKVKDIAEVGVSYDGDAPCLMLEIDREAAGRRGVSAAETAAALEAYGSGIELGRVKSFGESLPVKLQVFPSGALEPAGKGAARVNSDAAFRRDPQDIFSSLRVSGTEGRPVPLAQVARVKLSDGRRYVERVNLYPAVAVRVSPAGGVSAAEAWSACKAAAGEALPKGCRLVWLSPSPEPGK
jgi:multidrug efflux pump subunit AcrB